MNQSYFLKNLPAPLQFWIRPMLLISLALHGLLLAVPMPSEKKHTPAKKEPEKVKITQLPTKSSSPAPKAGPSAAAPKPKNSPVVVPPKPSPVAASPIRPRPQPIRQAALDIPPVPPRSKVIPRPHTQPTPEPKKLLPTPAQTKPSPTALETPLPSTPAQTPPSPTALETPSPSTPDSTVKDPNADFPIYPNAQTGSVGLLSGEIDKAARHTTDGLEQVVSFYSKELPARKFNPKPLTDEADLKVYEVSKEGGTPQYLHLISKDGKTVILLASQQVSELKSLKSAQARSPEEIAFDSALAPIKSNENFGAVDQTILDKLPDPTKFADTNKFRAIIATTMFKPMSPSELFAEVQNQLIQAGFDRIELAAPYGSGLTYKVTKGNFTTYLYFVANADNKTILLVSKDSPF